MRKRGLLQRASRTIREQGYSALFWKCLWKLPGFTFVIFLSFIISTERITQIDDAIHFAFARKISVLIEPTQIQSEILALCRVVRAKDPKVILEIGTGRGGTLFLLTRAAHHNALIISIDLPKGDMKKWNRLHRVLAQRGQAVQLIRGDSHADSTIRQVKNFLDDRRIDFLFIDGDHSYEGVKKDFENYSPFMSNEGIIAFHDINRDHFTRCGRCSEFSSGQVYKFWDELKNRYEHIEFVENASEDGFGIGVLFLS